ncbi:Anp1-domain-containing protein [Phascolomyces articulosus]|uniref:Anp1-domain-containing protein n=1 Tax=Phascolomyces articulosus TaxID=60185 RepID=A0AAD5KAF6_9FUNG|nr:Anp1-domain-containing protein [Phascolomyces articulosus]
MTTFLRGGRRLVIIISVLSALVLFSLSTISNHYSHTTCHTARSLYPDPPTSSSSSNEPTNHDHSSYYLNLNSLNATAEARAQNEHLLVLTPLVKGSVYFLDRFFEQLDKSTYPNHLISIGLLATDSSDQEENKQLEARVRHYQGRWFKRFHEINVYQRNFEFLNNNEPYDLTIMARARNFLLAASLRDFHSWVAWVDVNVIQYPPQIFEDLMRINEDVVVPNCLLYREDNAFWAYDRNNWAETDYSLEMQKWVGQDYILMEGSGRSLLVDMPTHMGVHHKVPLDGVGATFTLVKSHVHREGANFPPFVYQHQVEAEAFGKVANAMGFSVYGLPGYMVYHAGKNHDQ